MPDTSNIRLVSGVFVLAGERHRKSWEIAHSRLSVDSERYAVWQFHIAVQESFALALSGAAIYHNKQKSPQANTLRGTMQIFIVVSKSRCMVTSEPEARHPCGDGESKEKINCRSKFQNQKLIDEFIKIGEQCQVFAQLCTLAGTRIVDDKVFCGERSAF